MTQPDFSTLEPKKNILIKGAQLHNLKNLDVAKELCAFDSLFYWKAPLDLKRNPEFALAQLENNGDIEKMQSKIDWKKEYDQSVKKLSDMASIFDNLNKEIKSWIINYFEKYNQIDSISNYYEKYLKANKKSSKLLIGYKLFHDLMNDPKFHAEVTNSALSATKRKYKSLKIKITTDEYQLHFE